LNSKLEAVTNEIANKTSLARKQHNEQYEKVVQVCKSKLFSKDAELSKIKVKIY